jgi:hypothetical protein
VAELTGGRLLRHMSAKTYSPIQHHIEIVVALYEYENCAFAINEAWNENSEKNDLFSLLDIMKGTRRENRCV